jgi:hypothetical protein
MTMKNWAIAPPLRKPFFRVCLFALIVIAFISGWRAFTSYDDATSLYLSVTIQSTQEGLSALYYDVGKGYNPNDVVSTFIKGDNQVFDYLYKMPNKTLYHLRWDPPSAVTQDPFTIQKIEIMDGFHRRLKPLDLRQLVPLHQIQALELSDEKADIRVQAGANDPQIEIRLESPIIVKRVYVLSKFAGGILLEFAVLFFSACLLIYIWFRWIRALPYRKQFYWACFWLLIIITFIFLITLLF